jgi:hypothetical protein
LKSFTLDSPVQFDRAADPRDRRSYALPGFGRSCAYIARLGLRKFGALFGLGGADGFAAFGAAADFSGDTFAGLTDGMLALLIDTFAGALIDTFAIAFSK